MGSGGRSPPTPYALGGRQLLRHEAVATAAHRPRRERRAVLVAAAGAAAGAVEAGVARGAVAVAPAWRQRPQVRLAQAAVADVRVVRALVVARACRVAVAVDARA